MSYHELAIVIVIIIHETFRTLALVISVIETLSCQQQT